MRSPGKAKINASTLVDLYTMKDRYTKMLSESKPKATVKGK